MTSSKVTAIAKVIYSQCPEEIIDVIALAESLDIIVSYAELGLCHGFFATLPNSDYICINQSRTKLQQRFTLAHEIGHHLLPDTRGNHPLVGDKYDQSKEDSADKFAVELLIPAAVLVNEIFEAGRVNVYALAVYFRVELLVMRSRLKGLGLL